MDNKPGSQPNRTPSRPLYRVDADSMVDRPATSPTRSRHQQSTPRRPVRRGLPAWAGCGLFFIGFVVGVLGLLGGVFLLFGASLSNQPLVAPTNVPGTPNIAAQLSQDYLNSEVALNIKASPVKILSIADLTGLVLDVQANQQVLVTARIHTPVGDFQIGITEVISAENGQVVVRSTGQPRLGTTNIPINLNDFVNAINTLEVQPQINKYVTGVQADGRTLKLIGLQTSPGFITAKFNAQ